MLTIDCFESASLVEVLTQIYHHVNENVYDAMQNDDLLLKGIVQLDSQYGYQVLISGNRIGITIMDYEEQVMLAENYYHEKYLAISQLNPVYLPAVVADLTALTFWENETSTLLGTWVTKGFTFISMLEHSDMCLCTYCLEKASKVMIEIITWAENQL